MEFNAFMNRITFCLFVIALVLVPFRKVQVGGDLDIKLDEPVSLEVLSEFKKQMQQGYNLQYFVFDPKHSRYLQKHGTSGDELMEKIAEGEFGADEKCLHVDYIYGWFWQNCKRYYVMYRLSGDTYYIEQLTKYAAAMDWILANRPHILYPKERRAKLGKVTVDMIPWEPAAASNFIAHVYAGRLVLERARQPGAVVSRDQIQQARKNLATTVRYMESLIQRDKGLDSEMKVPAESARIIREIPWNQNMMYFAILAGTAAALEDLQKIERTSRYQETIDLYTGIVIAGIRYFNKVSDVTEIEGRPYVFHSHTPKDPLMPSKDYPDGRIDGHPIFRYPEDVPHSQSTAWNLLFIWATDERFGVTDDLLTGVVNTHVDYVLKQPRKFEERTVPRNHIISPWTERGRRKSHTWGPIRRIGLPYICYATFNSEVIAEMQRWAKGDAISGFNRLFVLYGKHIHTVRSKR